MESVAEDRHANTDNLSEEHRRIFEEGSAIAPDVTAARGVRTISKPSELPKVYSDRQRRRGPGWLATVHRPNGKTATVFRADRVDPGKPNHKYEQEPKDRGGAGNVLDVHPFCRQWIAEKDVPVIFTEGTKKADSLITALRTARVKAVVVSIIGCWNWVHNGGQVIPDMSDIPLEGRSAVVIPDSDVLTKWQVQLAFRRLAEYLRDERAARVYMTFFEHGKDGSKVGADDFFAGGGTLEGLRKLTRPYKPDDFRLIRLSRDEQLRATLEDLAHRIWSEEWKAIGGHTDRDVALKLTEAGAEHGRPVEDGLLVYKSWGALQLETKVPPRTLSKSLKRLEERGFIVRRVKAEKPHKCGGFVLRAKVYHYRREAETQPDEPRSSEFLYVSTIPLRAPRLRWSSPGYKPRRGTIKDTRRVRAGARPQSRPAIKRLGKIRCAIVDALDAIYGGSATLQEIADALNRKRPRDIRRRLLPMLEEAGVVAVDGDVVSLAEDWQLKLHKARIAAEEVTGKLEMAREDGQKVAHTVTGADEKAAGDLRRKRREYRERLARKTGKRNPDGATEAGMGAMRRSHQKREAELHKDAGSVDDLERVSPPDPALLAALREFLRLNPGERRKPAIWLANTLWAFDLYPGKPDWRDVEVALYELEAA